MSKIRSKNTKPERTLRSALYKEGVRYRIHMKDLPGKPDIVIPKHKIVIFVNGCFWHHHENCADGHIPSSNTKFWENKILNNIQKDKVNQKLCKELGWNVLVIWECEIEKNLKGILDNISNHKIPCT